MGPEHPDDEEDTGEREDEPPADRLERLSKWLLAGDYVAPALKGLVLEGKDGKPRPLAVPPYLDRVAQRAAAQVLTPALDELMYHGSYGYRRGRSRHAAARAIEVAYKEGCRYVYEADIDDFFDSVDRYRLSVKLHALYGDESLIERVLSWMAAPVEYQGALIERREGLPQGSPLSPLLANLVLDGFDGELASQGLYLVRFADNFVIACKSEEEAAQAGRAAVRALAALGLAVNPNESRVTSFAQGFRFLGYLFVNGLALDVSGERGETAGTPRAPPPPKSWLARLGAEGAARPALRPASPRAPATPESRPMPQGVEEGTVLFVTGAPALLRTRTGRLSVERDGAVIADLTWNGLASVVLLGPHHVTGPALRAALHKEVPVHFASGTGRWQGTLWNGRPGAEGHGLWLLQAQCCADPARVLPAARSVVEARLRHLREVVRQRARATAALAEIDRCLDKLRAAADLAALNGLEGYATRAYFGALAEGLPDWMGFEGRVKRPPRDPMNAMLSLGYTVLYQHVETVIRASGLLPWLGFYHQGHGRHAALASDLMEPFRHQVERTALAFSLRGRVRPEDFRDDPARGCRFTPEALRRYLAALSERFDTPVTALGRNDAKSLHGHLRDQNRALIDWIRGRRPDFQAWRLR
jgi:group II intron reverse transcriptase/maturase/CRISPR-associated endonuclease Cas1